MINSELSKTFAQNKVALVLIVIVVLAPMSGCVDILSSNESSEEITTSGEIDTSTEDIETKTTVQSPTSTPAVSPSPTPNGAFDKEDRYQFFREGYVSSLNDYNISVLNSSVDSRKSRMNITYRMEDPDSNMSVGNERENITLTYALAVKYFIENKRSYMNRSWAPKNFNVTAVTPAGKIYERAYTTRKWAIQWIDGEFSTDRYLLEYYGTIEPGPANPDYGD